MVSPNEDYYAWTQETIEKLRQGRLNEVSIDDLIEEIEDMGISQHHALESRLAVLLAHLLKWQYQSTGQGSRSSSWRGTINGQRFDIARLLKRNPSLRPRIPELIHDIYPRSVQRAMEETNLPEETFPLTFEQTGWSWEEVMDDEFYPD
jgi:hypothetical protein